MSEKSIEENIEEWISKQGYPLEILVAEIFQKISGLHVTQSHYYKDTETQKSREIDVLAYRYSNSKQPVMILVNCLIECKSATGKPWILFASNGQREKGNFNTGGFKSSPSEFLVMDAYLDKADNPSAIINPPIFQTDIVGHGITQAFTEGHDIPYKAVMSAVNASQAREKYFDSHRIAILSKDNAIKQRSCSFSIPVVVIEDRLFECKINRSGKPVVREVDYGILHWKGDEAAAFVPIVTKPKLLEFANQMDETMQRIIEFHESNMDMLNVYSKNFDKNNVQGNKG